MSACRWLAVATRRCPIVTSGSPRNSAQMVNASRKNVETLMPPAVLALPPPMNISTISRG